ncbi:MAG: hypothetical protein RI893_208 [Pseudomonadota bacterium]|jgi:hypothetical protein
MQQTLKAKHELRLYELKKAADEFLEFTENLTLLAVVNQKALEITQAVAVLQQDLAEDNINASEAAILLDEIVDADAMSELEVLVLSATASIENVQITEFLTEIMDKVEHKYNRLLEKAHAYNALLLSNEHEIS